MALRPKKLFAEKPTPLKSLALACVEVQPVIFELQAVVKLLLVVPTDVGAAELLLPTPKSLNTLLGLLAGAVFDSFVTMKVRVAVPDPAVESMTQEKKSLPPQACAKFWAWACVAIALEPTTRDATNMRRRSMVNTWLATLWRPAVNDFRLWTEARVCVHYRTGQAAGFQESWKRVSHCPIESYS